MMVNKGVVEFKAPEIPLSNFEPANENKYERDFK
jgi:hypothetical protein